MLSRFRLLYKLRVTGNGVQVVSGQPGRRFIFAVRDVVALHGVTRGEIECKGRGRHARLRFSDDFPEVGRQAIRNVWAPPTTPGPGSGRKASG